MRKKIIFVVIGIAAVFAVIAIVSILAQAPMPI